MKNTGLFIFFMFFASIVQAQNIINSELYNEYIASNISIPILEITTTDGEEPTGESLKAPEGCFGVAFINNAYVNGRLRIIQQGDTLYDSGEYKESKSGVRIKIRGNTSASGAKKPYKIKLSKKEDLLFRNDPKFKDKEWVLLKGSSQSLIKFITTSHLAEMLNFEWVPQHKYVNLVLNGDFKGDYILVESVKKGNSRINIDDDGFIIEDDVYWWESDVYFKGELLPYSVGYTFKYPDADDVNDTIIANTRDFILGLEETLKSEGDISQYIDIENFAAWLLAQDILGQYDSFGTNRFLYRKDKNSVMKIGPLWDTDGAFRKTNSWSDIHVPYGYSFYFQELLARKDYIEQYVSLWKKIKVELEEKMSLLYNSADEQFIEDFNKSQIFDSIRWQDEVIEYKTCVEDANTWFRNRVLWMDNQISTITNIDEVSFTEESLVDVYTMNGQMIHTAIKHGEYSTLTKGFYIIKDKKTGECKKIFIKQ